MRLCPSSGFHPLSLIHVETGSVVNGLDFLREWNDAIEEAGTISLGTAGIICLAMGAGALRKIVK